MLIPLLALLLTGCPPGEQGMPGEQGLIEVESNYGVQETADRLEEAVEERGMQIATRIDHG